VVRDGHDLNLAWENAIDEIKWVYQHCETPSTASRERVPFGRFDDAFDGMIDRLLKPYRSRLTSLLVPPALPQQFTPRSRVKANSHR
jgi:hypothetical protein